MNTTFDSRTGSPPNSPSRAARAASRTCSTISAADRLRVSPICPVAQNGQAMPQPAWLVTHSVARSGYFISTDSTLAWSMRFHSVFTVSPSSAVSDVTLVSRGGNSSATRSSRAAAGRSVMSSASTVRWS